jgi:hypothetical protein
MKLIRIIEFDSFYQGKDNERMVKSLTGKMFMNFEIRNYAEKYSGLNYRIEGVDIAHKYCKVYELDEYLKETDF